MYRGNARPVPMFRPVIPEGFKDGKCDCSSNEESLRFGTASESRCALETAMVGNYALWTLLVVILAFGFLARARDWSRSTRRTGRHAGRQGFSFESPDWLTGLALVFAVTGLCLYAVLGQVAGKVLMGVGALAVLVDHFAWRPRRRRKFHRHLRASDYRVCPGCEYSLEGHGDVGVCPECGIPYEHSQLVDQWTRIMDDSKLRSWGRSCG